jgi:hypothetical protein
MGKPQPWFERNMEAAKELADMFDELGYKDKELLKASFTEIAQENPKTEVAALRIKKIGNKLKEEAKVTLYEFTVVMASDTAKKILADAYK